MTALLLLKVRDSHNMWLLAAIGHIATTGADSGFWGEGWLLFVHVLVQAVMSSKRPDFVQLFQLLITLDINGFFRCHFLFHKT